MIRPTIKAALATLSLLLFVYSSSVLSVDAMRLGLYDVDGTDSSYGAYTGLAELRETAEGGIEVIHLTEWTDARFEGDSIALAWAGTMADPSTNTVAVTLNTVGYISDYAGDSRSRDPNENAPITYRATAVKTAEDTYSLDFDPLDAPNDPWTFEETWTWREPSAATAIWRNERQFLPAHAPMPSKTKRAAFRVFASYHTLPEVAPYVDRPEFQAAMHYRVFDPTDYDYYQQDGDRLRVIQQTVDAIALVEARQRADAYRYTLAEKQAIFDPLVVDKFLNEAGMVVGYDPADSNQPREKDSMLWTGAYIASQSMRYLVTGDPVALDNVIESLNGQLICYEIVPTPGLFARTLRPYTGETEEPWVRGEGEYADLEWLPLGNNDMLKGYFAGLLWGQLALERAGGDPDLQRRMIDVVDGLLAYNPLLVIEGIKDVNDLFDRMVFVLLVHLLDPNPRDYLAYSVDHALIAPYLERTGNNAIYWYGIADWSGLHLGVQTMLTLYEASRQIEDPLRLSPGHLETYRTSMARSLEKLEGSRGLSQLVYGTLADEQPIPAIVDEALWLLREMPTPKSRYAIDHRINPTFVMSPLPELPWKFDWNEGGRLQSLYFYPIFEQGINNYQWRVPVGHFTGSGEGELKSGVDYLFGYWFSRYYGVIGPED